MQMKVTLKFPHTHADKPYPASATIEVSLLEALWLKSQDVIHADWDALKAEIKKIATKDNPAPYAAELETAIKNAVEPRQVPADASTAAASAANSPANSAAAQESTK